MAALCLEEVGRSQVYSGEATRGVAQETIGEGGFHRSAHRRENTERPSGPRVDIFRGEGEIVALKRTKGRSEPEQASTRRTERRISPFDHIHLHGFAARSEERRVG